MNRTDLQQAFSGCPQLIRRKHIRECLNQFLGECSPGMVVSLTTTPGFPRATRIGHKTILYSRDRVVEALARILCQSTDGGAS